MAAEPTTPMENDDSEESHHQHNYETGCSTEDLMESLVRVTLAGFGGSIVGLSQEKRLESIRVVTGAAATAAARRKRSPAAQLTNLPMTWALSCMAFCIILETSRLTSPSTWIVERLVSTDAVSEPTSLTRQSTDVKPAAITIADFTIGGTVAGMAGSFGRHTYLRKRLPSSMFQRTQRFFGVGPGIALGVVGGFLQVAIDYGAAYFEKAAQQQN